MEKAFLEIISRWQSNHHYREIAINWDEISLKMHESSYHLSSQECLSLWCKLVYNLDQMMTEKEEVRNKKGDSFLSFLYLMNSFPGYVILDNCPRIYSQRSGTTIKIK
jgi:hypothetical protein